MIQTVTLAATEVLRAVVMGTAFIALIVIALLAIAALCSTSESQYDH